MAEREHISELQDAGKHLKCLLVGNGLSVRYFNFGSVPADTIIFEMNFPRITAKVHYQIYHDVGPALYWEDANRDRILIGYTDHAKTADYFYGPGDMIFGDVGFHALQFADKIFNFDKIYLIGYDYEIEDGTYHWFENISDPEALRRFKKHSIDKVSKLYYNTSWTNRIYNLNKTSLLTCFEYTDGIKT